MWLTKQVGSNLVYQMRLPLVLGVMEMLSYSSSKLLALRVLLVRLVRLVPVDHLEHQDQVVLQEQVDQEVLQEQVVHQELRVLLDHLVLQGRVELVVKVILLLRQVLRMLHILM
jgi:hypothetical protein